MDERLRELLVLGREHYERRELDRAEEALRQVLEHHDGFADVYNMLGVIHHDRGDFAGAESHFEKAVELNPAYTEALLNLSVTYNDLGKYEAARQAYSRIKLIPSGDAQGSGGAPALDPFALGKIANMHADLAQAYLDAGCSQEAIDQLEQALRLRPGFADLHVRLGNLYRSLHQLHRARDCYAAARDAKPDFAQARVLLGITLVSLGRADEAVTEFREVLKLDPGNTRAKMYLRMVESARVRSSQLPPPFPAGGPPSSVRPLRDRSDDEGDT